MECSQKNIEFWLIRPLHKGKIASFCSSIYSITSALDSTQTDGPVLTLTFLFVCMRQTSQWNMPYKIERSRLELVCLSVCYSLSILSPKSKATWLSTKTVFKILTLSTDSATSILIWI